ncbi:MAG TPA: hypothetical protein VL171_01680 [Verrucomicrobiae bacterium]|nr:hypothetical protein [Verrucomicrobiae bacterium]
MSEVTATTAPPETEETKKFSRGVINSKHIEDLDKASSVVVAAKKDDYKAKLLQHEIDDGFVTQLEGDIAACRVRIAKAGDYTSDIRVATDAELKAKNALKGAIRSFQAAAKQKYARTAPLQLKDYFIGEDIDISRVVLTQVADSIIAKVETDSLPGVTREKFAALKATREAYVAANNAQADVQSKATAERNGIDEDAKSINNRRVQIQFAVEAEWPADGNGYAPIRREFHLPVDRPLPR